MSRAALVAPLLIGLLSGCAAPAAPTPTGFDPLPVPAGAQQAVVVRHTDGDTLVLRGRGVGPLPGEPTKVRLLLLDTPEIRPTPECLGPEAATRLAQLVPKGAAVRVEADRDPTDRFGRALLHLWDDKGTHVGQVLLAEGLARVLVVRPNVAHLPELRDAEAVARSRGAGVWACPGT